MSSIICMVCKKPILAEAFRFDDDLGGFVHFKCKPFTRSDYDIEMSPLSRSTKKFSHPLNFMRGHIKK